MECDDYVKAYKDLRAFIILACHASSRSEELALDLLHKCCRTAVDYGRASKAVRDDVIQASLSLDEQQQIAK